MTPPRRFADLFLPTASRAAPVAGASRADLEELWAVVSRIPHGAATSYGAVARAAGLPGRARLAGRALREAPEEMNLPWHRVVGAGGRVVFPPASRQAREQTRRLRAEGVLVLKGRVAPTHFLIDLD